MQTNSPPNLLWFKELPIKGRTFVFKGAHMILELQRWRAPWALMLLLLLLEFNSKVPSTENVQFVELFAGQAEVSCALRSCGLFGSTHDINIDPQYMDLCSTTGFLHLCGYM